MAKKRRKKSHGPDPSEGRYTCPTCGEEIVIPLEVTAGAEQRYVEDCPVCCHPNVIHVELDPDWPQPRVWAESE
jgi:transcription elongation factor Elf1